MHWLCKLRNSCKKRLRQINELRMNFCYNSKKKQRKDRSNLPESKKMSYWKKQRCINRLRTNKEIIMTHLTGLCTLRWKEDKTICDIDKKKKIKSLQVLKFYQKKETWNILKTHLNWWLNNQKAVFSWSVNRTVHSVIKPRRFWKKRILQTKP